MGWGREEEADAAAERLLDAAGRVFEEKGVLAARMVDVAEAAGCSRGTLYRYFPDGDALRQAFVDREARRVGRHVAADIDRLRRPDRRLVGVVESSLAHVRAEPILMAWFTPEAATTTGLVAARTEVVSGMVDAFLVDLFSTADPAAGFVPRVDHREAAEWVVRVIQSLLAQPADDERALLEHFLVPALFDRELSRR